MVEGRAKQESDFPQAVSCQVELAQVAMESLIHASSPSKREGLSRGEQACGGIIQLTIASIGSLERSKLGVQCLSILAVLKKDIGVQRSSGSAKDGGAQKDSESSKVEGAHCGNERRVKTAEYVEDSEEGEEEGDENEDEGSDGEEEATKRAMVNEAAGDASDDDDEYEPDEN